MNALLRHSAAATAFWATVAVPAASAQQTATSPPLTFRS
jgi:hypothetical protein